MKENLFDPALNNEMMVSQKFNPKFYNSTSSYASNI